MPWYYCLFIIDATVFNFAILKIVINLIFIQIQTKIVQDIFVLIYYAQNMYQQCHRIIKEVVAQTQHKQVAI